MVGSGIRTDGKCGAIIKAVPRYLEETCYLNQCTAVE